MSLPLADSASRPAPWPGNRAFAFTVIDDTDWAAVKTVKPVYDLLADLGFRTTKTVWMFRSKDGRNGGETCEQPAYRDWVVALQEKGFEIALHNPAAGTSPRARTRQALDEFKRLFGHDPTIHCNHTGCGENLYWGDMRVTGWRRGVYRALASFKRNDPSQGHVAGDPVFWGDLCRERVRYVRNFVFDELNTLKMCPAMPYHDPGKPFVNFWFSAADAGNLATFLRNVTCRKIDELVQSGGACVLYTHFGGGFATNGVLHHEFEKRMRYIASRSGWFAPVSTIMDHLRQAASPAARTVRPGDLAAMERRWLANEVRVELLKRGRRILRRV